MTAPIALTNINVLRDFSYTIATSSIVYVRNYNFNTATNTPIPVLLQNKNTQIPITVDISASNSWVTITNPTDNRSVVTPQGNVVLPASSSKTVVMNINLPPEIETLSDPSLQVSMSFYVRSGSFPISQTETNQTSSRIELSKDIMYIRPEFSTINQARVYVNDLPSPARNLTFDIEDDTIATIVQTFNIGVLSANVVVRGLQEGTTTLRVFWQKSETETITTEARIIVTSAINADTGGGSGGSGGGSENQF